ncbi:MAG: hypothetical protein BA863_05595 [Desulfovibrio sp. S3730MH75]|nr:MAG: hypothetical protein BA863_05595 [Desulfovibrio sp. S3730MH75]
MLKYTVNPIKNIAPNLRTIPQMKTALLPKKESERCNMVNTVGRLVAEYHLKNGMLSPQKIEKEQ